MHKIFRYPIYSESQKGSPTNFFGTVRPKLWQKIVIHPPLLLSITFFDTRNFLKHRRVPLRNFWTLWDKKLIAVNSDIPFLCVNFFDTRLFLKHRRVPLRKVLVMWDKNFEKLSWYTPTSLIKKILRNQKVSETPKCIPTKFFGTQRQKNDNKK